MSPTVTTLVMVSLALAIIAWDILLAIDKRDGNTISERMRAAGKALPFFKHVIVFALGLLVGHWFW